MESPSSPLHPETFLDFWHLTMIGGAIIFTVVAIVMYVLHKIRVSSISDFKKKYDFINEREIKTYKLIFFILGVAFACVVNLYGMGSIHELGIWFFVRIAMSIFGGTLIAYVAYLILHYYFPTVVDKKLQKLRFAPRISSAGNPMRLLSEAEEDVHLEEGMKAEEDVFSVDYDVWIDESTNEVKIEKYPGRLQAHECKNCGFYTMKIVREEIVKSPDGNGPGELIKNFQCSYCKCVRRTSYVISTKDIQDYTQDKVRSFNTLGDVSLVRVEIHTLAEGKKFYEFQSVDQAQNFLKNYPTEN
jgi:hypothetical protein